MQNPYQSPASAVATSPKRISTNGSVILFVIGLITAVTAAAIPMQIIPKFRDVFISFGAELPVFTSIVVNYHLTLWLLPIFVIATKILLPPPKARALAPCLTGVLSLVLILPLVIFALYMPIFMLGAVS